MANYYCHGEARTFSESEFRRDSSGQLSNPLIHDRGRPHYDNGLPVDPPDIPTIDIKTWHLAAKLHLLALQLSENELQDLMTYTQNKYNLESGV